MAGRVFFSVTSTSTTDGKTCSEMERKTFCIASKTLKDSAGILTAGTVSAKAVLAPLAAPAFPLQENEIKPNDKTAATAAPTMFLVNLFI